MSDFVIGSGMTEGQLKAASFWVRHRILLRRLGYGTLITVTSGLWLFNIWGLLDAYAISYPRESRIPALINQHQLTIASFEANTPQPVSPSEVLLFATTDNRQDFVTEVYNPNPSWWAEFTYQFDTGSGLTPERKGYILPEDRSFLTELGWKGTSPAVSGILKVDNVRWHRVDPLYVDRNWAQFRERRQNLQFTDIAYNTNLSIEGKPVGQTTFTLKNDGGYGYWNLDLVILLYRAESPVGVSRVSLKELKPGEVRPISVNWLEQPSGISKTEIIPQVNLMDPKAFLPTTRF